MSRITKISNFLKNPKARIIRVLNAHASWFSDKSFIKLKYRLEMGKRLNLKNPRTFCEKLQWLKLYDHKPEYTAMVDKKLAKEYVANLIGKQYIIQTIGVWETPDQIDFSLLPDQFVLKTTHAAGSSGVIICKDKKKMDFAKVKSQLWKSLNTDTYLLTREWPYKNIKPCIIAEKFINDESGDLKDYKFFCFNGEPKVMLIASNRFTSHNFDYYDMSYNHLAITSKDGPNSDVQFPKPKCFEEMKIIASKLCNGHPFLRVDLYNTNGKVYFGELTFFDSSGFDNLSDERINDEWGSWIKLPIDK